MASWSIQLENIAAAYGPDPVLQGINLSIHPGDITAIIGPNGAGKTTLLHIILGIITPTHGKISIHGHPRIGYLPQQPLTDRPPPIAVSEWLEVSLNAFTLWRTKPLSHPQITTTLHAFDLAHLQHRRLGDLSTGELQRVMIAASLIQQPDLLILDEPTTGIDAAKETALETTLKQRIHHDGLSLLFVSHDLHWVSRIAKQIICLNRSHCVIGPAQHILQQHILSSIYGITPHTHA
jgi:zinc transport system ATP-binding protein